MVAAPRVGLLVQQLSAGAYAAARAAVGGAGQGQLEQLAEEVEDWAGLDQTSWPKNSARVCSQRVDKNAPRGDAQENPFFRASFTCCETCRFARAEHSPRRANSNFETASGVQSASLVLISAEHHRGQPADVIRAPTA